MTYIRSRKSLADRSQESPARIYSNNILQSQVLPAPPTYGGMSETIIGSGHKWPPHRRRKKNVIEFDIMSSTGGEVEIKKAQRYFIDSAIIDVRDKSDLTSVQTRYTGKLRYGGMLNGIPSIPSRPPALSDATLLSVGAKAWAKYKPTAQQGGLGQALGELHDLPSLPKLLFFRNVLSQATKKTNWKQVVNQSGSEYLNVQFGWVPLISDIKDLIRNVQRLKKGIEQLERDNGRPVRRSGKAGSTSSTTSTKTTGTGYSGKVSPSAGMVYYGPWTEEVVTTTTVDYRFSARFRYFIDFAKAHRGDIGAANRISKILLGAELSPYTLYQLMPWSWLIDWFTNTGSVINNIVNDAGDNLVADYAYINGKVTVETVRTLTFSVRYPMGGDSYENISVGGVDRTVHFRRIQASPYGFGLNVGSLSNKQLAILGALGLSRW